MDRIPAMKLAMAAAFALASTAAVAATQDGSNGTHRAAGSGPENASSIDGAPRAQGSGDAETAGADKGTNGSATTSTDSSGSASSTPSKAKRSENPAARGDRYHSRSTGTSDEPTSRPSSHGGGNQTASGQG